MDERLVRDLIGVQERTRNIARREAAESNSNPYYGCKLLRRRHCGKRRVARSRRNLNCVSAGSGTFNKGFLLRTFSEIYLSYHGKIPASEFSQNFAPDEKFNYRRDINGVPERFIRAYHLRDPETGKDGPWLAGMTLNPSDVSEAWCHQRNYVCLIEEIGERPIQAGQSFGAAYIIGYFDSIDEMNTIYDQYKGHSGLVADDKAWRLTTASQ